MKVLGLRKLLRQLEAKIAAAKGAPQATIGYTMSYALIVHENLQAYHKVGQAKYLEQPMRTLRPVLRNIIRKALREGRSLRDAVLLAALKLQAESQKLVPVATGALKGSAFTRLDE